MHKCCRVNPCFGVLEVRQLFQLCMIARHYTDSKLVLQKKDQKVFCTQLIALMTMLICGGDELVITATGEHAEKAIARVEDFLAGESKEDLSS